MNAQNKKFKDVDDYISRAPKEVQAILERVRNVIKTASPDAVESIAYEIPAYKFNGKPLVYFAAFSKHIGFYATPQSHEEFTKQLSKYKQGKGSVQFPLDEPIPYDLIKEIVVFKTKQLS